MKLCNAIETKKKNQGDEYKFTLNFPRRASPGPSKILLRSALRNHWDRAYVAVPLEAEIIKKRTLNQSEVLRTPVIPVALRVSRH